jgi:3',5'-cyclic AMP phosphodiesterase CpdA
MTIVHFTDQRGSARGSSVFTDELLRTTGCFTIPSAVRWRPYRYDKLIVSGDVAYNHCHMFVGATTVASRTEWIAALDRLDALDPAAVVMGHKDPTQGNPPTVLVRDARICKTNC